MIREIDKPEIRKEIELILNDLKDLEQLNSDITVSIKFSEGICGSLGVMVRLGNKHDNSCFMYPTSALIDSDTYLTECQSVRSVIRVIIKLNKDYGARKAALGSLVRR